MRRRFEGEIPSAFGTVSLRVTLLIATWYAVAEPMHSCGERAHHLALLGLLVPGLCALPHAVFVGLQLAFISAAAGWAMRRFVPWTAWAATLLFVSIESARQETSYLSDHEAYTITMALVLHCAWFHFRRDEIRAHGAVPMPRWLPATAALYLGWTYALSGIAKLWTSGPAWADGESLRLWLVHSGGDRSALGAAIVASPLLARALATVTLAVELLALPATLTRATSIAAGVILVGMHVSTTHLFGVAFWGNVALCAIFLVWIPWRCGVSSLSREPEDAGAAGAREPASPSR